MYLSIKLRVLGGAQATVGIAHPSAHVTVYPRLEAKIEPAKERVESELYDSRS
jgi:hypothetical protein